MKLLNEGFKKVALVMNEEQMPGGPEFDQIRIQLTKLGMPLKRANAHITSFMMMADNPTYKEIVTLDPREAAEIIVAGNEAGDDRRNNGEAYYDNKYEIPATAPPRMSDRDNAFLEGVNESWYEDEVEATFAAYGMDEIEIDLMLNDPDVDEVIKNAEESGFSPEKTALYLLQKADESGLIPNEQDISEYADDEESSIDEDFGDKPDAQREAQRVLDLISADHGSPSVRDIVTFIVKNWEEVTGTPRSEMYAEQDFPDVILEIMDFIGIDADDFGSEWESATEREFEDFDDGDDGDESY
jgi:hypothetical protein